MESKMNYSIITESYFSARTSFTCIDAREHLYSKNNYEPTSALSPIEWEDLTGLVADVTNIADNGDLCVSKAFAELVMSFDPFGIECYPAKLILEDGVVENRYILALNNIIDVMDDTKSVLQKSPKRNKMLTLVLFLSEEKLGALPLENRILYRVKGAETTTFYCEEIFDLIENAEQFGDLRKIKLDTNQEAPKF